MDIYHYSIGKRISVVDQNPNAFCYQLDKAILKTGTLCICLDSLK